MSKPEAELELHLRAEKIGGWVREHRFHATRRWRLDFAWIDQKFAVEIEGGAWVGGRHTRGKGFTADLEKYEAAMLDGWTVYRCSPEMVSQGRVVAVIRELLAALPTYWQERGRFMAGDE